jgi:hypothetical protein
MKKLLLFILLSTATSLAVDAQKKFYYYPASNVYYDLSQKQYVYLDGSNWTPVRSLPAGLNVGRSKYVVYSQTPEVWNQNAAHVKKYKAPKQQKTPNGKAVGYKGTNPNKAAGKANGNGHKGGKGKH